MKKIDFGPLIIFVILLLKVKEVLPCYNLGTLLVKTKYFRQIWIQNQSEIADYC